MHLQYLYFKQNLNRKILSLKAIVLSIASAGIITIERIECFLIIAENGGSYEGKAAKKKYGSENEIWRLIERWNVAENIFAQFEVQEANLYLSQWKHWKRYTKNRWIYFCSFSSLISYLFDGVSLGVDWYCQRSEVINKLFDALQLQLLFAQQTCKFVSYVMYTLIYFQL